MLKVGDRIFYIDPINNSRGVSVVCNISNKSVWGSVITISCGRKLWEAAFHLNGYCLLAVPLILALHGENFEDQP